MRRDDLKRATVRGPYRSNRISLQKISLKQKQELFKKMCFLFLHQLGLARLRELISGSAGLGRVWHFVLLSTMFWTSIKIGLGGLTKLMVEIKEEEKEVTEEFNRVQEGMVSPSMVELTRHLGRPRNGAEHNMESAVDRLSVSMEALVECADLLRRKTGILLVEILKPAQAVRFFAAAAQLQLNLRRWGMQRNVQNRRHNAGPANEPDPTQRNTWLSANVMGMVEVGWRMRQWKREGNGRAAIAFRF
ncbi:hypothetical protein DH2020_044224 [Rehmannia glutinosa]|uniref:DOG1 domain-containing protein n=1 Tax=Rehmannia glutinosa TaxID=99300 RepID=A0ABR0UHH9_REHGL